MKLIKWFSKTAMVALAFFSIQVQAAETPAELIKTISAQLFNEIKTNRVSINKNPEQLKDLVNKYLIQHVDVNYTGKQLLGTHFAQLPKERRQEYYTILKPYLVQQIAQALATYYKDQQVDIGRVVELSDIQARTPVVFHLDKNVKPIEATFFWLKRNDKWAVYDLQTETFSLVDAKKEEFSSVIKKSGFDSLFGELKKIAQTPITMSK